MPTRGPVGALVDRIRHLQTEKENSGSGRVSGAGRLRPVPRGACAVEGGDATVFGRDGHLRGISPRLWEVCVVDGGPSASAWRISSHSLNGDTCVAVAAVAEGVLVRGTKQSAGEARVHLARRPWQLFLTGLRSQGLGNEMWT
ncbi:DUF397 domain-containing protein [Streptomyces guryensis]|uniref:DUF397 domain-containing protein n=1 Tax=Streptomyces guryensis TaxID=2886947 RepID=UPI00355874CA